MKRFSPDVRVDQEKEYRTSQPRSGARSTGDTQGGHLHRLPRRARHSAALATPARRSTRRTSRRPAAAATGTPSAWRAARPSTGGRCPSTSTRTGGRACTPRPCSARATCRRRPATTATATTGRRRRGSTRSAFVCGQCHGREAAAVPGESQARGLREPTRLHERGRSEGLRDLPREPDAAARARASTRLGECVSCHGNHGVVRPTVALLAPLPATPCAFCHEPPESVARAVPEPEAKLRNYQRLRDALLEEARFEKVAGPELFDWLVDRALALPTHTRRPHRASRSSCGPSSRGCSPSSGSARPTTSTTTRRPASRRAPRSSAATTAMRRTPRA